MTSEFGPVASQVMENKPIAHDVLDELGELMEEYGAVPDLAAQRRDPSIPEGTVLAETDVGGVPTTFRKQSSMVRMGKVPMPERTAVYRWPTNEMAMVATAALLQQLSKTNREGHRVFSRHPWPDATPPVYITKVVPTQDGRTMSRRFVSEGSYRTFMRMKHPEAWDEMEAAERRRLHDEEIAAQRELAAAMLAAVQGVRPAGPPSAGRSPGTPALEHLNRDGLLAIADEFRINLEDRRSVEKIREAIREYEAEDVDES